MGRVVVVFVFVVVVDEVEGVSVGGVVEAVRAVGAALEVVLVAVAFADGTRRDEERNVGLESLTRAVSSRSRSRSPRRRRVEVEGAEAAAGTAAGATRPAWANCCWA